MYVCHQIVDCVSSYIAIGHLPFLLPRNSQPGKTITIAKQQSISASNCTLDFSFRSRLKHFLVNAVKKLSCKNFNLQMRYSILDNKISQIKILFLFPQISIQFRLKPQFLVPSQDSRILPEDLTLFDPSAFEVLGPVILDIVTCLDKSSHHRS